jgi:thymidylate synthase
MRSCDYHLHFRNDIYLACKLLNYIAKECGFEVGDFFMNIGSFHIYKKDWDATTF